MPHDRHGKVLQVGDRVLIHARITSLTLDENYCNLTAETEIRMKPSENKTVITLNAGQVELVPKA